MILELKNENPIKESYECCSNEEAVRRAMNKQYFSKHTTNQPCDFCNDFSVKTEGNHIRKDEDGQLDIMGDTGDAFWGVIENVKYCPYCGRRL